MKDSPYVSLLKGLQSHLEPIEGFLRHTRCAEARLVYEKCGELFQVLKTEIARASKSGLTVVPIPVEREWDLTPIGDD